MQKPITNDYWGSSMVTNDSTSFRIYFQNINGLTAGNSLERWLETVKTMKEKQCEIFGLAETNRNWQSNNMKTNIDRIIKTQFVNSSTILSSNRYNPDNNKWFQPGGGTLQACTGHWKSHCLLAIHDSRNMSRWTVQKFQLKHNKTITIITAYRPCKQNINMNKPTSSTTYRQQVKMLTEEGIINPDPRKIFIDDIINMINEHSHKDNYIILMLDANENVNDTESA
jgi:hypothetical protein